MDNSYQLLVLRDNAKHELEQIKSIEDGIPYLNKLKAIEIWVKAEKKDAELQNIVAEQKLRTQRILGELIEEGQRKGTIATAGGNTGKNQYAEFANVPEKNNATLDEIGISRKQSSNFQAIASIPEDDFEEFIQEKKTAVNNAVKELTTAGAVRLAKSLQKRDEEFEQTQEMDKELNELKDLKELAKQIKSKYSKKQISTLIKILQS